MMGITMMGTGVLLIVCPCRDLPLVGYFPFIVKDI